MNVRLSRHTARTSDNDTLIRILKPMDWVLIKFHTVMEEMTITLRPRLVHSGRGRKSAGNNRRCPQIWIGGSKALFLQNKRGHMLAHITNWHTHKHCRDLYFSSVWVLLSAFVFVSVRVYGMHIKCSRYGAFHINLWPWHHSLNLGLSNIFLPTYLCVMG